MDAHILKTLRQCGKTEMALAGYQAYLSGWLKSPTLFDQYFPVLRVSKVQKLPQQQLIDFSGN